MQDDDNVTIKAFYTVAEINTWPLGLDATGCGPKAHSWPQLKDTTVEDLSRGHWYAPTDRCICGKLSAAEAGIAKALSPSSETP